MKYLTALLLLPGLFSFLPRNKQPLAHPLQVFYHSDQLDKNENRSVKDISVPILGIDRHIKIIYTDHHSEKIADKNIWGYSDSDGVIYRNVDGVWQEVVDRDHELIIYRHHAKYGSVNEFSIGLDGELYNCSERALRKASVDVSHYDPELIKKYF